MQLEVAKGVLGGRSDAGVLGGRSDARRDQGGPPAALAARPRARTAGALSPSRAADFMQCPLLYRFRVVDQLPEPVSAAAARGTLVHAVLERLFELPATERTVEAAVALVPGEWDRLLQEEPEWAALVREEAAGAPDAPGASVAPVLDAAALAREAAVLVQDWFEIEDPMRLEPEETELYVEADLDGLVIRGVIDRLDVAPDGRLRVVDYKTGRAPSETFEGRALFQLKFYALALWRSRGVLPSRLQLVYPRDKTALWIDPTEAELLATERKVLALWAAIEQAATSGDWRPRPGWACRWCAHQAVCPTFGGTPPPLPPDATARALDPRAADQSSGHPPPSSRRRR